MTASHQIQGIQSSGPSLIKLWMVGKDKFGLKNLKSTKKVSSRDPLLKNPVAKDIFRPVFQGGF